MSIYRHPFLPGLKELLRRGADVNQRQKTSENSALHLAAMNGHLECVTFLLENGADFKAVNKQGLTPQQLVLYTIIHPH